MRITHSTLSDLDTIFSLYDAAIAFQKTKFHKHWQGFDLGLVETEIREQRHYKILEADRVACIFSVAYSDPIIWETKDTDPAVYFHRIVTNPDFRGRSYVKEIVQWGKEHCKETRKKFLRMDTWGDNKKLIDYYTNCGFKFLGLTVPQKSNSLPKHYDGISLSLFEINI